MKPDLSQLAQSGATTGDVSYWAGSEWGPASLAELVQDIAGAAIVAGSGVTVTYNDATGTITIASTGGYTDEQARDAIGAALVAGSGISITVNDAGDTITVAASTGTSTKHSLLPYSYTGTLVVAAGTFRLYAERALTISQVRASVGTAPTGAAVLVDVNKNGTTIFTTQSNRPSIAIGSNTAVAAAIDVPSLAAGDYLTVDIDQIGSTVAGANLTVTIEVAE